ncbi:hypothetical protein O6H91_22G015500 [Diphasiastrum complanatum]|uniref:Uncharacterized protein n=1 Tax=Diphasiastrum complanatum TaxID=34168 RepID=A0ACC2AD53_DIPCM|nr:hypothetical protein O6H91_22G015500 [Diphasiastrum complanatum]
MATQPSASFVLQHADGAEEETDHVLDITGSQLHDLLDVELPEDLLELDLTANRLCELDGRIGKLSQLQKFSLRQNLLNDDAVQPLGQWSSLFDLKELVLRDNKLTMVPPLSGFTSLLVFDISFNELTSTHGMAKITSKLRELYASKNEIVNIDELEHFNQLQILELGSNKIRVMEGLHNLTALQELWLGRNRIRAIDLCGLNRLEKISLQSNRLSSMLGIQVGPFAESMLRFNVYF